MGRYQALWEREIIEDEIIVFVERQGVIYGNLAFIPQEIIEVKDRTGKRLTAGVDFDVDGRKIILRNSSAYFFKEEWLRNENVPDIPNENKRYGIHGALLIDPKYLWERQILVSYKKENTEFVQFLPDVIALPKTLKKLQAQKTLILHNIPLAVHKCVRRVFLSLF